MDLKYDEFGNYIGGGLSDDDDDDLSIDGGELVVMQQDDDEQHQAQLQHQARAVQRDEGALVLHEDKKYYQDAEEIYPTAKTVTFNEDAMDISEPLIKPVKPSVAAAAAAAAAEAPSSSTNKISSFHASLLNLPALTRHVSVIGHIHHGKTSLIAELLQGAFAASGEEEAADSSTVVPKPINPHPRKDEQARCISIKSNLSSAVLTSRSGKSFLLNLLDNPGHCNFHDESRCSLLVSDGALVVVDAVEGVMVGTQEVVRAAVAAQNTVTLVINKVDRLVLELKVPPQDAYFKLLHIIEEFSALLSAAYDAAGTDPALRRRVGPELGNVCFASTKHGWSFTLDSFAGLYTKRQQRGGATAVGEQALAKRLWGDWYLDERNSSSPTITRNKPSDSAPRTFVQFVLEPLYKIYAHVLGSVDDSALMAFLRSLRLSQPIQREEVCSTTRPMEPSQLLRIVLSRFLGDHQGVVDMLVAHVPGPLGAAADRKAKRLFAGSQRPDTPMFRAMVEGSVDAPLVAHVAKLHLAPGADADLADASLRFLALARVYSGRIEVGSRVKVLGEAFSPDDDEDAADATVAAVFCGVGFGSRVLGLPGGTYAPAGSLVLLRGVDASIKKTATLVGAQLFSSGGGDGSCNIFRPPRLGGHSIMKVSIEPLKPAQLPKMLEAVRCVCKSYPLMASRVEGSGEHCLMGPGELYFDCALADLRTLFGDVEVKVSDPVVVFCETVVDSSRVKCTTETPNKQNRFSVIAEPLDDGLAVDIESGRALPPSCLVGTERKDMEAFFTSKFGWDRMAVHSIWAFGLDSAATNVLLDDTLGGSKESLRAVKNNVVQGFRWASKEGPLCDEAMRNVKFKILQADVSPQPLMRAGGQVIPTVRRAVYSSFLMATPRLLEPVYRVEIQAPADVVQALYPVIQRRRGFILEDVAKPGAPFYLLRAFVPVMDRCV